MNPYLALLRTNRNYRLLFIGQAISQLGDWFNTVAVYALVLDLTGSATSVAWMMIVQFLPFALVGPMAGSSSSEDVMLGMVAVRAGSKNADAETVSAMTAYAIHT